MYIITNTSRNVNFQYNLVTVKLATTLSGVCQVSLNLLSETFYNYLFTLVVAIRIHFIRSLRCHSATCNRCMGLCIMSDTGHAAALYGLQFRCVCRNISAIKDPADNYDNSAANITVVCCIRAALCVVAPVSLFPSIIK